MVKNILRKIRNSVFGKPNDRQFVVKYFKNGSIGIEIGVWKGEFTAYILKSRKPSVLHLVDPWKTFDEFEEAWFGPKKSKQYEMDEIFSSVSKRFENEIQNNQIVIHRKTSVEASFDFKDDSLDWIYIDGNHTYEYVKDDLEKYLPKVKIGGIIAGDDYHDGGWWNGGVKQAVDELIDSGQVEVLRIFNKQFVLKKK